MKKVFKANVSNVKSNYTSSNEKEKIKANIDSNFLKACNVLSEKYNMVIDWENTSLKERYINFQGNPTHEQKIDFLKRLEEIMKKMYNGLEVI